MNNRLTSQFFMKRFLPKTIKNPQGFTLVELLVVVSIIAILSIIGVTVFSGVQKNARDARRKSDIDAWSKAYEVNYDAATNSYKALAATDFANGLPTPPEGGTYDGILSAAASGYTICARLDANPSGAACTANSATCFCKNSSQGAAPIVVAATPCNFTVAASISCKVTGVTGGATAVFVCPNSANIVANACSGGGAPNAATTVGGANTTNVKFYDAATNGNLLGTGNIYTNATTTTQVSGVTAVTVSGRTTNP